MITCSMRTSVRAPLIVFSELKVVSWLPLTTIVGFTQVLPEMVSGEAAEFVELMGRESLHLGALIANLLDTSGLEAGVLEIRRDTGDVSRVAQEAVDLVSHLSPEVDLAADIASTYRSAMYRGCDKSS